MSKHNFKTKFKLNNDELMFYNQIYAKNKTCKKIDTNIHDSNIDLLPYEQYVTNKRLIDYLSNDDIAYSDRIFLYKNMNQVVKDNKLYDEYLNFLFLLSTYPTIPYFLRKVDKIYIVDKIKTNYIVELEFHKLQNICKQLLKTIVLDNNLNSIISLSEFNFTNPKNLTHYLHEYINKEMKTVFYKTKSDKRLDFDLELIVYQYAQTLALFLTAYVYRYDIFNKKTNDIELFRLDLWETWLKNQL